MENKDIKNMSYLDIWSLKRKMGFVPYIIKTGFYALIFLMFVRVCINLATGNIKFTTMDGLILIVPAILIATILWYVNEYFYKRFKANK